MKLFFYSLFIIVLYPFEGDARKAQSFCIRKTIVILPKQSPNKRQGLSIRMKSFFESLFLKKYSSNLLTIFDKSGIIGA